MLITRAIELAETEHVVYFLVAAYVETLQYYEPTRTAIPGRIRALPLGGGNDVADRLRVLRELAASNRTPGDLQGALQEAVDVFTAATVRLQAWGTAAISAFHRSGNPAQHGLRATASALQHV